MLPFSYFIKESNYLTMENTYTVDENKKIYCIHMKFLRESQETQSQNHQIIKLRLYKI